MIGNLFGALGISAGVVFAFVVTPAGLTSDFATETIAAWVVIIVWLIIKELIGDDEADKYLKETKKKR